MLPSDQHEAQPGRPGVVDAGGVLEADDGGGREAKRHDEEPSRLPSVRERETQAEGPQDLDVPGRIGDGVHDEAARLLVLEDHVEQARQEGVRSGNHPRGRHPQQGGGQRTGDGA